MKSPPAPEELCAKGVFQIQPPISGVNFSNNMSVPPYNDRNFETS